MAGLWTLDEDWNEDPEPWDSPLQPAAEVDDPLEESDIEEEDDSHGWDVDDDLDELLEIEALE